MIELSDVVGHINGRGMEGGIVKRIGKRKCLVYFPLIGTEKWIPVKELSIIENERVKASILRLMK